MDHQLYQPGGHGHRGGLSPHQFQTLIGVCNIPIGMKMFITDVLQLSPSDELNIDLFGLNHLVFVRDVLVNGVSRFDELLTAWPPAV